MRSIFLSSLVAACLIGMTAIRAQEPTDPLPTGSSTIDQRQLVGTGIILESDPIDEPPAEKKPTLPSELPEPIAPPRRVLPPSVPEPNLGDAPSYNLITELPFGAEGPPVDVGRRRLVRSEFLMWWYNPMSAPPLVTTAVPPNPGFIGFPTTQILYGNGTLGDPFRLGYRLTLGWWADDEQTCGVDGRFFFIGQATDRFFADSTRFPVLVRPFFAPNPGIVGENGQFVAYPPGFGRPDYTGNVIIDSNSKWWGAELNAKEALLCMGGICGVRVDLFGGYRYMNLDEDLLFTENVLVGLGNPAGLPPGTRAVVRDHFATVNQFHGGQVGAVTEVRRGRFYSELRASLALGNTNQRLNINGFQLVTRPGLPTQLFGGGLLALPGANAGKYSNNVFSVVPELHWHWGYNLLAGLRIFIGYNFLFWSNVIRPGSEIDRVIDVSRVPNFAPPGFFPPVVPSRPRVLFNQTGVWAQGIDVGFEWRW